MKIEIWSDIMCPFCYIGKRRFEQALAQFEHREDIKVEWKSFQLNPSLQSASGKNATQYLAEIKGWSYQQAKKMNDHVTNMAAEVGLVYHLDHAVVANSFAAHRMLQLAKEEGKGDAMEEALFKAYFTDGKNTADHAILLDLAVETGLDRNLAEQALIENKYAEAVSKDIYEAMQIGVRGVPFFLLNDHYTISGAQPQETFAGALEQAWSEWKQQVSAS